MSSETAALAGSARGVSAPADVESLVVRAVRRHAGELESLAFLPEARYDRSIFPTAGQYDWASGQVLYSLVRETRPRVMVEFSTSSGYSTTFSALALRANGMGRLYTVDIDAVAQEAARRWLAGRGLDAQVEFHLGDCRDVVPTLLGRDPDIVFIDTLHSFEMAEWYLLHVVPRLRPDCLVHIHDVMPPEARVRIHGGPPYRPAAPPRPPLSHLVKRALWLTLHLRWPNPFPARPPREALPLERLRVQPPGGPGELPTIDGNYFEEAVLVRELLRDEPPHEAVYLHRLERHLALAAPQRYAPRDQIGRQDARGRPLEWNDALWCRAALLQRIAGRERVRTLIATLRRTYGAARRRPWR